MPGSILENTDWDVKVYNADFIPSINRKKISYLAGKGFNNYIKSLNDLSADIWREVKDVIEKYNPSVIGISVKSAAFISLVKIELQTFFLVGYPYETEEMLKDTIKMMKKSKSDKILYSIFTPYPSTALYEFCERRGLIKDNFDPTLYNHQSPLNCFSMYIKPERFRVLASKIEKMIDRRNLINRLKYLILLRGFPRLSEVFNEYLNKFNIYSKPTHSNGKKEDIRLGEYTT